MHAITMTFLNFIAFLLFIFTTPSDVIQVLDKEGVCPQEQNVTQSCEEGAASLSTTPNSKDTVLPKNNKKEIHKVNIYFFEGTGCPFCQKEKIFLDEMRLKFKGIEIKQYEVWHNRENAILMQKMLKLHNLTPQGVPVTFIGDRVFIGFSDEIKVNLQKTIERCLLSGCHDPYDKIGSITTEDKPITKNETIKEAKNANDEQTTLSIPFIGNVEVSSLSLPVLTFVIAGLDSFNPCAFFVLFALLGLLTHAGSRKKIFLIGGIFVFFSGFIYFLFMAAWLNLFIFMGNVSGITTTAGIISLIISIINIKDFFAFKKGISLTIPESAKPGLFDKMRRLMRSTSTVSILVGTVVLAVTANSYELLCTAGFPLVYTRILTLNQLSSSIYYLYLIFYNLVYIIPLFTIVIIFTVTFGNRKLSERQGRLLKLVSGVMMFELGALLLFKPELLNNVAISAGLLASAIIITVIAAFLTNKDNILSKKAD